MDRRKLPASGIKRYHALYTLLLEQLQAGAFAAQGSFPSEPALVRDHGVSRNTVRRALERLEGEGWIRRRRGGRTIVSGPIASESVRAQVSGASSALETIARSTATRSVAFERLATPAYLAQMHPGFGSEVLRVQRLRSLRGEPFALLTSYLPEWLIPHVTRRQLGTKPLALYLEARGLVSQRGEQVTTAVSATVSSGSALGVDVGAPLISVRRMVFDASERLLEYQDHLYHPARYQIRMDVEFVRQPGRGSRWVTRRTEHALLSFVPRPRGGRRASGHGAGRSKAAERTGPGDRPAGTGIRRRTGR